MTLRQKYPGSIRFTYITGNPAKIQSAREQLGKLGIEFAVKQLDLTEPQLDTIEEVASAKALQAFAILKKQYRLCLQTG